MELLCGPAFIELYNALGWKGSIRITESSSWPCTGNPKSHTCAWQHCWSASWTVRLDAATTSQGSLSQYYWHGLLCFTNLKVGLLIYVIAKQTNLCFIISWVIALLFSTASSLGYYLSDSHLWIWTLSAYS